MRTKNCFSSRDIFEPVDFVYNTGMMTGIDLQALKHIDADRLIAAPDCGLGFLDRKLALAKLTNMVSAAKSVSD